MSQKKMKKVKLSFIDNGTGYNFEGKFENGSKVLISDNRPEYVTVLTDRGAQDVYKHPSMNLYMDTINKVKVHVSLKKLVGELRYWA